MPPNIATISVSDKNEMKNSKWGHLPPNNQRFESTDHRQSQFHGFWHPKSRRMHVAIVSCYGFFVLSLLRVNIGTAMVCMVNSTAIEQKGLENEHRKNISGCKIPEDFKSEYDGDLQWSTEDQAWQYSAAYMGQIFTSVLAGALSDRFGPKRPLIASMVLHLVGTLLTPVGSRLHVYAGFAARLLIGIGQGFIFPSFVAVASRWYPTYERATFLSLLTSGNQIASVVAAPMGSWLCGADLFGGWPAIFYVMSLFLVPLAIFWIFIYTDDPQECCYLGEKEKLYLQQEISHKFSRQQRKEASGSIPWRHILRSPPVYAIMLTQVATMYCMSVLQSYLPTFYKDALYMELQQNGFATAAPFLALIISKFVVSSLSEILNRKYRNSATLIAKGFQAMASYGTAVCLLGLFLVDCRSVGWGVAMFVVAFFFMGGIAPGFIASMAMIAPRYSGLISSLSMTVSVSVSTLAPYQVGAITPTSSIEEWRIVFGIMAAIVAVGGSAFVLFGSAKEQNWADVTKPRLEQVVPVSPPKETF